MKDGARSITAAGMRGCTTLLAGKDATADGSVLAAFNSDGGAPAWLELQPRMRHNVGAGIPVYRDWRRGRRDIAAYVPQVGETAQVLSTDYLPCMNEHQVGMVLNACRSRRLLRRAPDSSISHFQLMRIALERARTARGAIELMGSLVEDYGLLDVGPFPSGKNVGVIDPHEAWWFNAPGGHEWVAQRVPDGAVSVNANRFWLGGVGDDAPQESLHSRDLIRFAVTQGWYDPASREPFSFSRAYGDHDGDDVPSSRRVYSTLREWRAMSLVSGSSLPVPIQGTEWMGPHYTFPPRKVSILDVFALLRDHYEGTPFDTTRPENGGGLYGCPHPPFVVPTPYPRPIDMFNTQVSYVAQARDAAQGQLPGVLWFCFHSPSTGCYVPLFPAMGELPHGYETGDAGSGAFWRFFSLSAAVRLNWGALHPVVRETYDTLEREWIAAQPSLDQRAMGLRGSGDEREVHTLLSSASCAAAARALETCHELTLATRVRLAELLMQETLDEPIGETH